MYVNSFVSILRKRLMGVFLCGKLSMTDIGKNRCRSVVRCINVLSVAVIIMHNPLQAETLRKETFVLGYMSNMFMNGAPQDTHITMEIFSSKAIKNHFPNTEILSVFLDNLDSMIVEFKKGKIDLLSILGIDYLRLRDKIDIEPLIIGTTGGKSQVTYLLLVNNDSETKKLEQLDNKKLMIRNGGDSHIGLMWLDTLLMEKGLPESESFIRNITLVDKPAKSVLPVFFGQADACIVRRTAFDTMVELNPEVGKKVTILLESPEFLFGVSCIRSRTESSVRKDVLDQFERFDKDPGAQQIKTLFQVKSIIEYRPEYIENLENLYNTYHRLRKQAKKPMAER